VSPLRLPGYAGQAARPPAAQLPVRSDKKLYNQKEKEEWILILRKMIGQDQQDR
jgi:hypothetical protein